MDETSQCAGAAIFRANAGVADLLPKTLHRLPKSEKAFATPVAFLTHHLQTTEDRAAQLLKLFPVSKMLNQQLQRANTKTYKLALTPEKEES